MRPFFTILFTCSLLASIPASMAADKSVLFLAGGRSHSVGEHEHNAGSIILSDALNKSGLGITSKVVKKWPKDLADINNADAVVIYADAGGQYNAEQLAILDKRVKAGMGIMFIHYGVHPSTQIGNDYFLPWIGGFFESGWSVNPHWTAEMTPKKGHPVAKGIKKPVLANDEFYYNMRFPKEGQCEGCYPLVQAPLKPERLTRYNNLWNAAGDAKFGSDVTLMWCQDEGDGRGRGIGFTGGHWHRNWAIDDFRKLALNAITWVAGVKVPRKGVPSEAVTDEQLNQNLDGKPRAPIARLSDEAVRAMKPMLRPENPAKYNRGAHQKLVAQKKKEAENK